MSTYAHTATKGKENQSPLSNRVWTGLRQDFQGIQKLDSEQSSCNQVTDVCYSSTRNKDNLWKPQGIFLLSWHECEVRNNWRTCDTPQKQKRKVFLLAFLLALSEAKIFLDSSEAACKSKDYRVCDKTQIPVANTARRSFWDWNIF